MVYEELKKAARSPYGAKAGGNGELSSAEISVMGAASKLVASIATYPSQVRHDALMPTHHLVPPPAAISFCTCHPPGLACKGLQPLWKARLLACRSCAAGYSSGRTCTEGCATRAAGDPCRSSCGEKGMRGLYKGLVPNVLRVMPQSAITFLVYERVMQLLEKHLQSKSGVL